MFRKSFSIWSAFDVEASPEELVDILAERGFTECELSDEHGAMLLSREGTPEEIGSAFRAYAESRGVRFPQGHLFLAVRLCDESTNPVEVLDRWIRLYAAIGVKSAVLHCDGHSFPPETPNETLIEKNAEVLKKIVPVAEKCGVTICIENLIRSFGCVEDLLAVIEKVGSPALGICLDTGHLNITNPETQVHFIRTAGKLLRAIHIADNQGKQDQHMMPYGRGNVDFLAIMKALDEIGYEGLFNYEIPGERCPEALRAKKTAYVKEINDFLFASIGK